MARIATIILLSLFVAGGAEAALLCKVAPFKGAKHGILVKPGKSGEFYKLMEKKLTDEAARCCVACIVPVGTQIIITYQGFASHTVRVVEGKYRGCVGDLPAEYVKECE